MHGCRRGRGSRWNSCHYHHCRCLRGGRVNGCRRRRGSRWNSCHYHHCRCLRGGRLNGCYRRRGSGSAHVCLCHDLGFAMIYYQFMYLLHHYFETNIIINQLSGRNDYYGIRTYPE